MDVWCIRWSGEDWKEYGWFRVDGTCPTRWECDWRYDQKSGEGLPAWTPGRTERTDEIVRQTRYFFGRPLGQYGIPVAREFGYKDDSCFIPLSEGHIPKPQLAAPGTLAGQTGIPWSEGHMPWSEGHISEPELAATGTLGCPPPMLSSSSTSTQGTHVPSLLSLQAALNADIHFHQHPCRWLG